jgi:tRNA G18 (ribose-2'-O)-methylase SpoU
MRYIVCENIRSAYNVGNIVRTADGLGRGVIISGYSAPLTHPKVAKTALGAEQTISSQHFHDIQATIDRLRQEGYTIIASEKTPDAVALDSFSCTDTKIAVIMGNEITGVEESTMDQADHIVHIPMMGQKESLNVGQAAAIMMWEL